MMMLENQTIQNIGKTLYLTDIPYLIDKVYQVMEI